MINDPQNCIIDDNFTYEIIKKFDLKNLAEKSNPKIYLVKFEDKEYIAKVRKEEFNIHFENESRVLNKFVNYKNIIKNIRSGKGTLRFKSKSKSVNYIIMEYASKHSLFYYIEDIGTLNSEKNTLNEEFTKYIFYRMVECVENCHKEGICHRNLKLENFYLGNNFDLKFGGFGYATENKENLDEKIGMDYYIPPEIYYRKKYNGFAVDIFFLGICLIDLFFDKKIFQNANEKNLSYKLIIKNDFANFWKKLETNLANLDIPPCQPMKNLLQKMLAYEPEDRPSIVDVKNDPWLESIRTLIQNGNNLGQFEEKLRDEFRKREEMKKKMISPEIILSSPQSNEGDNRSSNKFGKIKFNKGIMPEEAKECLLMKYVLTIKGETKLFKPNNFMSNLIDECEENDISTLIRDKGKLRFVARKIEDNDEDDNKEHVVLYHILVELYKHGNEYQLCIKKLEGIRYNINMVVKNIFSYANTLLKN